MKKYLQKWEAPDKSVACSDEHGDHANHANGLCQNCAKLLKQELPQEMGIILAKTARNQARKREFPACR